MDVIIGVAGEPRRSWRSWWRRVPDLSYAIMQISAEDGPFEISGKMQVVGDDLIVDWLGLKAEGRAFHEEIRRESNA